MNPRKVVVALPICELPDGANERLSEALGVRLRERNSSYWGGRYFCAGSRPGEMVYLFTNTDVIDGVVPYPQMQNGCWLIRIDLTQRNADDVKLAAEMVFGSPCAILAGGV